MENNRFSLSDTLAWALRSVLDNARLFWGALFVMIGIFVAWVALLLLISRFTFFLHQSPDMREFLWQFRLAGVLKPRTPEVNVTVLSGFGVFISLGLWCMGSLLFLGYTKLCLLFERGVRDVRLTMLIVPLRQLIVFMVISAVFSLLFIASFFAVFAAAFALAAPFSAIAKSIFIMFLFVFLFGLIYFFLRLKFFVYYILDTDAGIIDSLRNSYALTRGNMWNVFLLVSVQLIAWRTIIGIPLAELAFIGAYRTLANRAS